MVKKFRIFFIVPDIFGDSGDAVNERQLAYFIKKIVSKNDIIIFSLVTFLNLIKVKYFLKKLIYETNIKVLPLPIIGLPHTVRLFMEIFFSELMALIAGIKKVDLIYVRSTTLALVFILLKKIFKYKVFVKISAVIEDEMPDSKIMGWPMGLFIDRKIASLMIKKLDKYVLANADRIITDTRAAYLELVKRREIKNKCPPLIMPPGVNFEKTSSIIDFKRKSEKRIVGFVGSLFWWQGGDILVRSISIVKKQISNIELLIVGDGPQRLLIENMCKDLNVPYKITGYLPHIEALKMLMQIDVLVIPSRRISTRETKIPIKIIEAWALGVPVVTTKHKIFLEYGVIDQRQVVFCEPDPLFLSEKIIAVLLNEELKRTLQINGKKFARNFNYEDIAKKLIMAMKGEI